jgi:pimeloyl-ACP methyl ester carboxylesterase
MPLPADTPVDRPAAPACAGDALPCGLDSLAPSTIHLADALERFRTEATHELFDNGHYRCSYHVWGEGPTLVLIPGIADDAFSFVLPAAALSRHFRCITYDLPAGGDDHARLSSYRHADFVADLLALLDHAGAGTSYLFGSSFGGTVVLAALHAQPARFPSAVLQGGFARRPLAPAEILLARFARYWPGPMRRLPFRTPLMRIAHGEPFAPRPPEVWDYYLARCGAPPMATVARRALLIHQLDLRPILSEIRQPVLLVCGDHDPLVGRTCEDALLRGLPDVRRVELARCGHLPQYTHPDVLADIVRRFLLPLACVPEQEIRQKG